MKNILLCQHGGSGNHGCEALARTAIGLLKASFPNAKITLYTYDIVQDRKYLSDLIGIDIKGLYGLPKKYSPHNLAYHAGRLAGREMSKLPINREFRTLVEKADLVVAIGGDNYCYNMGRGYWVLDRYIKNAGKKYMLFGCSIEPDDLPRGLGEHLKLFDSITVRERISYSAMKLYGLDNAIYAPDPAFLLEPKETQIPKGLDLQNAVGINISPLVIANEKHGGMTLKAFAHLCRYILDNTQSQIALIPHVVWPTNDDRKALAVLKAEVGMNNRVFVIPDHSAMELKYIIGSLDFFVGARTHSTIAAYSMAVPTLTMGYSVKARGIATDLFGTEQGYVVSVKSIEKEDELTQAFIPLYQNRSQVKEKLQVIMPEYKNRARRAVDFMLDKAQSAEDTAVSLTPVNDSVAGIIGKDRCTGCAACAAACPLKCIEMQTDDCGFWHYSIDEKACTGCGVCRRVCPSAKPATNPRPIAAFAAADKNKDRLISASSGGVFGALARKTLQEGGVVFGAAFDDNGKLMHTKIDKIDELSALLRSKYLQSDTENALNEALFQLKSGKKVFFCGTSCQANAMAWLAPKELRKNLLIADVVCHGVPSPKVFGAYAAQLESAEKSKITGINFRDKSTGWADFSLTFIFENGKKSSLPVSKDPYMRLFLSNLSLRKACYTCISKKNPKSDLTLGDFWGIKYFAPKFDYKNGASLVLVRTQAGQEALDSASSDLILQQTAIDGPEKYSPYIYNPPAQNPRRDDFFADFNAGLSIDALAEKYAPIPKVTVKQRVKKILKK